MFKTVIKAENLLAISPDRLLIFDCSFDIKDKDKYRQLYGQSHIKGAFYAHLDYDLSSPSTADSGNHPLPDKAAFVNFLNNHGMQASKQVVVYDNIGGGFAARMWWMLKWVGHAEVALLEGFKDSWINSGVLFDDKKPPQTRGNYVAQKSLVAEISIQAVSKNLADRKFLLIDSRESNRFHGIEEPLYPVKGHIPGSKNRFFLDNLDTAGNFKSKSELKDDFSKHISHKPPEEVVFYCGSGVTACLNILAMEHAGYEGVQLYVGSWSQWIKDANRPVSV